MTCHICGGDLEKLVTDLPFKVAESRIVIIKGLPVLQCRNCSEYVVEDAVMEKVELGGVSPICGGFLEIVRSLERQ